MRDLAVASAWAEDGENGTSDTAEATSGRL